MSTKRKLDDIGLDDILESDWKNKPIKSNAPKHSLDSDEEDDDGGKNYDILNEEEIEGQEEGIVGVEGGIQITPFNMKEEMEEGHFDTDGMYHWKNEGKVVRDNWLENIDWVKIHNKKQNTSEMKEDDGNELSCIPPEEFDDVPVYKEMMTYLKPKETVAKALRRLAGNTNISTAERWKRKKAGFDLTKEEDSKQNVSKLTELANKILQNTGNMDVYQETYEYISEKVESANKKQSTPMARAPELDMYADDFDTKEKERLEIKEPTTSGIETAKPPEDSGVITWEFKWEKDSSEISGPHSSEQMLKWVEDGHFKKEVWVRKCGQLGEFYTSKRIDFDLYI